MKPDVDEDVAKINKDAMMPTTKAFRFEIGDITTDLGEDDSTIKSVLKEQSEKAVREAYEEVWEGDFARLGKMPLESFLPMLLLKQISSVATTFEITPDHLDFGFDPEIFYKQDRPFFKKKRSMLKEIDSEFSELEEEQDPYAFQLILDENVVNAFLLDFVLYEKAFSMRQIMKMDDKMRPFLEQLNTTNIGMLLPQFIEEFGEDKSVDFYLSLSHSLISKKIENAKVSGF
jgi:hypothetical protein